MLPILQGQKSITGIQIMLKTSPKMEDIYLHCCYLWNEHLKAKTSFPEGGRGGDRTEFGYSTSGDKFEAK
jgi:hypothetical protein